MRPKLWEQSELELAGRIIPKAKLFGIIWVNTPLLGGGGGSIKTD